MSFLIRTTLLVVGFLALVGIAQAQEDQGEESEIELSEEEFGEVGGEEEGGVGGEEEGGVSAIPEPSALLTFAIGSVLVGGAVRRHNRRGL